MKKLLVLTLVLSVASLTSAKLIILGADVNVNPGDSLAIGIISDGKSDTLADLYKLIIIGDGEHAVDITGAVNTVNPTNGVFPGGPGVIYNDFSIGTPPPLPVPEGQVVSGILLMNITKSLILELRDSTGMVLVDDANVVVIPEPATMVLLGVGALVLRRRK